jgi:hypothetical protein
MKQTEVKKYAFHELAKVMRDYGKGERSFFHTETIKAIKPFHRMCWGYNSPQRIADSEYTEESLCFYFKHTGMKMQGVVAIFLGWEDLYKVRFFEKTDNFYQERFDCFQSGIYCEQLSNYIDSTIEL